MDKMADMQLEIDKATAAAAAARKEAAEARSEKQWSIALLEGHVRNPVCKQVVMHT